MSGKEWFGSKTPSGYATVGRQLKYDVDSEVGAGKGANNQRKFEEAVLLYNTTGGVIPSLQTMMDRTNSFDTEEEFKRVMQEQGGQQDNQQQQNKSEA